MKFQSNNNGNYRSTKFIDIVNTSGDDILNSKTKSSKIGIGHINLVGKVHKEIQIPLTSKENIK